MSTDGDDGAVSYGPPVIGMSRLQLDPDGHIEGLNSDLDFARTDAAALRVSLEASREALAQARADLGLPVRGRRVYPVEGRGNAQRLGQREGLD